MADEGVEQHVGRKLFGAIVAIIAIGIVYAQYQAWEQMAAGKAAHTVAECIAAVDMDSLAQYESALNLNDTFGMAELIKKEKIFRLEGGTSLLVLESTINFRALTTSFWRRRARFLDGLYQGKAAWLTDKSIAPGPPSLTPTPTPYQ
jgi:hypothetical protein